MTGGAHCMPAPYRVRYLRKIAFRAFQASRRGGAITRGETGDRIEREGACVFYLEGEAEI